MQNNLGLDFYMDDLEAILDEVGVERADFCGESFGGLLGMALAATTEPFPDIEPAFGTRLHQRPRRAEHDIWPCIAH